MRLAALLLLAAAALAPRAAQAQDQNQELDRTLADIRQELSVLYVEIQRLNRELSTTRAPGFSLQGDFIERQNLIEGELRRLTADVEELEFRVDSIAKDGANRLGDLEFRLCELEPDCDPSQLGLSPPLGGIPAEETSSEEAPPAGEAPEEPVFGALLAEGERADFDAAMAALDEGRYREAADGLLGFVGNYPGSPLAGEAHYYRGTALEELGEHEEAARAYLSSFSSAPDGPLASDALFALGLALDRIGQWEESCLILAEVPTRFPDSAASADALDARTELACS